MDQKITIIDVARKAGVSKGTVDRVLHNRGEVSAKSAEKVRKAIEELNFHPNMYASLLASKKPKTIICLMPQYEVGEFWEKEYNGFMDGAQKVASLNVNVEVEFYNQYDATSFVEASERVLEAKPDGVVMPALFQEETHKFAQRLQENEIPYVYVDTKVSDDDKFISYIGMPRRDSGFTCGALLTVNFKPQDVKKVMVVRIKREGDPTKKRRMGFMEYMSQNFPAAKIYSVYIDPSKPETIRAEMDRFFETHPDIRFIVMFNSRIHLIAEALREHPSDNRCIIGFDDLPQNLEMLRSGMISALIAQHTEDQSSRSVVTMADYIISRKLPQIKDNYVHIDILTRYNIEHY